MIHWFYHVPFSPDSMSSDLFSVLTATEADLLIHFDRMILKISTCFGYNSRLNESKICGGRLLQTAVVFTLCPMKLMLLMQLRSSIWDEKNTTNNVMTSARWLGGENRPTSVCRTLVKCWQKIEWTRSKPDAWPAHVSLLLFVIYRCFFRLFRFLTLHSVCGREGHRLWIFVSRPFECRAICEAPARLNWSGG